MYKEELMGAGVATGIRSDMGGQGPQAKEVHYKPS